MSNNEDMRMTPAAFKAAAEGDFGNALVAATPGGIERQEREGQATMTRQFDRLPREHSRGLPADILERLGFVVGAPIDELFVQVEPPAGRTLRPTDHSMWSEIFDEKGRKRGGVFYKAAFYDRRAHLRLDPRYTVRMELDGEPDARRYRYELQDLANGTVIEHADWRELDDHEQSLADELRLVEVMRERYPDVADVTAYWD
jgi:hypothetical protein